MIHTCKNDRFPQGSEDFTYDDRVRRNKPWYNRKHSPLVRSGTVFFSLFLGVFSVFFNVHRFEILRLFFSMNFSEKEFKFRSVAKICIFCRTLGKRLFELPWFGKFHGHFWLVQSFVGKLRYAASHASPLKACSRLFVFNRQGYRSEFLGSGGSS